MEINGKRRLERGEPFSKAHARRGCYTPGHKREKKCDWIPMTRFHMWSRIVMLMRRFSSRSAGVFRQPPLSSYSAPDRPTERPTHRQTLVWYITSTPGFYNPHSALIYMMYIDGHQIRHSSLSLCSCCALWFNRWLILLCDKELVCNWIVRSFKLWTASSPAAATHHIVLWFRWDAPIGHIASNRLSFTYSDQFVIWEPFTMRLQIN